MNCVSKEELRSINSIHLQWPTWWPAHHEYIDYSKHYDVLVDVYDPVAAVRGGWVAFWNKVHKVSQGGQLGNLHVTILPVGGIPFEQLLPSLRSVQARKFVVEVASEQDDIAAPDHVNPFWLIQCTGLKN
jgi:hypothetical protein